MTRYDNNLAARKKKWLKLYELADAAAMVYDEEQRAKKGKSKIVSEAVDYERIRLVDHVPRKIRSSLRYPQENNANLNGASTSSSLLHRLCFEPLDYNTATKTPHHPNPNSKSSHQSSCLTEYTSRKRRPVVPQGRTSNVKFKKAKVAPLPRRARETPEWLVQVMGGMNRAQDSRLIFERILSPSDVNSGQSRLLIPFNMLNRNDFLTLAESRAINKEAVNKEDEKNIGVGTILVNQRSEKWGLRFKIWVMEKKNSGNGTLNYALNWGWNDVVRCNDLRAGDEISLWAFRCRGVLCFALEHRVALPSAL